MAASALPASDYILIASRDDSVTGLYAGVLEKKHETRLITSLPAMHSCIASERPALLFIDPHVCADNTTEFLISLIRKLSGIFVVIIDNQSDRLVDQRSLFKAGARGFCKDDIAPALLMRAVNLVLEGEYWIQRKLITQMISELASEGDTALEHSNF